MLLIASRLPVSEKSDQKPILVREAHLSYAEILKEVCAALTAGYEVTYFSEGEFHHLVTFLKYGPGDKDILILAIRGTKEEIDNLQIEPCVKKYFNL